MVPAGEQQAFDCVGDPLSRIPAKAMAPSVGHEDKGLRHFSRFYRSINRARVLPKVRSAKVK
jgi:hypothetical protein